jgi:multiple antibiotic resistance protein
VIEYAFLTFASLFSIVDPFAAIPAFLAMTANETAEHRKRTARLACTVCWAVLSVFALLGPAIFRLFGITLPAFQIAGGLIMLLSALDMLRAKRSSLKETAEETQEAMSKDEVAITPLAIPMLSGPGAITTSIVLAGHATTWGHVIVFYLLIALVSVLCFWILTTAAKGARKLGHTALNIITRLMGLVLAAIGIQFILTALKIG